MHHDFLGPYTLTNQTGQVAWAAKLDPSGNVLQEYNHARHPPGDPAAGQHQTGIGITIRWWGVISIRIRLG